MSEYAIPPRQSKDNRMSNIAISIDFTNADVTFGELRKFVEATTDYEPDDEVTVEINANHEISGFKAWV